jgi:hypothetical protein
VRIVVLGYIVRGPVGGLAWHHLQYVLGLVRLGHDVRFVEDSDDYPACYNPVSHVVDSDPSYGLRFATDAFARLGIGHLWSYYDAHTSRWLGPDSAHAEEFCRSADLVLNLSGMNPLRDWTHVVPVRALVDTDPVFTQVRHLSDPIARARALQHTAFFSYAENIEAGTARIPDDGFTWRATRQPIVLDCWALSAPPPGARYTTVMQWQSYSPVEFDGIRYGTKSMSFEPYIDLPRRTSAQLEMAVGGADAPRDLLRANGWSVQDPLSIATSPWDYRNYISGSRGEFTVANQGYVVSNCGWFSDRSAAYLASGRPVVTQETGFSDWLPVGSGLFAFQTSGEALEAVANIERDYIRHSGEARRLAEEYFDSVEVLSRLTEQAIEGTPE